MVTVTGNLCIHLTCFTRLCTQVNSSVETVPDPQCLATSWRSAVTTKTHIAGIIPINGVAGDQRHEVRG